VIDSAFIQFGQNDMRQDCPAWIEPYPTLPCHRSEHRQQRDSIQRWQTQAVVRSGGTLSAAPVSYVQELLNIYVSPLPGHPDSANQDHAGFRH